MKSILLTFKTKTGEKAYHKIDAQGKKQSFKDRQISNAVAKDVTIQESPLIVRISIKIPWLAVQSELDKNVVKALSLCGAEKGTDYDMEVVY